MRLKIFLKILKNVLKCVGTGGTLKIVYGVSAHIPNLLKIALK